MAKVKFEGRRNKFVHQDCFGHFYLVGKKKILKPRIFTCTCLESMKCRGCNFYKPLQKAYEECLEYGFPEYDELG